MEGLAPWDSCQDRLSHTMLLTDGETEDSAMDSERFYLPMAVLWGTATQSLRIFNCVKTTCLDCLAWAESSLSKHRPKSGFFSVARFVKL